MIIKEFVSENEAEMIERSKPADIQMIFGKDLSGKDLPIGDKEEECEEYERD